MAFVCTYGKFYEDSSLTTMPFVLVGREECRLLAPACTCDVFRMGRRMVPMQLA